MNKSLLSRLLVILLLVVMSLSIVSCDQLPFLEDIFGGEQGNTPDGGDETPACQHANVIDGKCYDCDSIIKTSISDLDMDKALGTTHPDGTIFSQLCYVEATVKELVSSSTGEMIIEDASGSIRVEAVYSEDGESYKKLSEKPDEADKVLLHCVLAKTDGAWYIKSATLVEFEAVEAPIKVITIAEAIEICKVNTEETAQRYYIRATITKVSNPLYGEMYIADETGELLVYNTKNSDGTVGYADMTERPVKGDEVLLYCTLNNHNGTNQVKSAWIVEFKHNEVEIDPSLYTEMNIADARNAEAGTLIKTSGVVAQITYANGKKPSGVILVDGTSSIYLYDGDLAGQVKVGNTVTVAGEKAYWILADETNNAAKFGYKGSCQLDNITLISNDNGNTAFDKSWIEETTVKEIMDTPVAENITNKIFKVTALVKRVDGTGFINYYIDDLDGVTGSYVYTQCNGGDFGWLDQFDGKLCTVYFVAINAKSTASGCVWRFLPIEVIDEGYTFDLNNAAEYTVKYHGVTQFLNSYTGDPALELSTQISSELLGFEGATLSYTSSDESVAYFTTDENANVIFNCVKSGVVKITVTSNYGDVSYSKEIEITVDIAEDEIDHINVIDAINAENNTTVTVKGIVGPSLVNQVGFYLIDESGAIPVKVSSDIMNTIELGYEIIVTGTRTITKDGGGQICIDNVTIAANYYGSHDYSTESFIKDATIDDIKAITDSASATTGVYVVTALVSKTSTQQGSYTNVTFNVGGLLLYTGNAKQYSWLESFFAEGETSATLTVELALCDWNAKGLKGCVLAVVLEDGTKVLNTLNFN